MFHYRGDIWCPTIAGYMFWWSYDRLVEISVHAGHFQLWPCCPCHLHSLLGSIHVGCFTRLAPAWYTKHCYIQRIMLLDTLPGLIWSDFEIMSHEVPELIPMIMPYAICPYFSCVFWGVFVHFMLTSTGNHRKMFFATKSQVWKWKFLVKHVSFSSILVPSNSLVARLFSNS